MGRKGTWCTTARSLRLFLHLHLHLKPRFTRNEDADEEKDEECSKLLVHESRGREIPATVKRDQRCDNGEIVQRQKPNRVRG